MVRKIAILVLSAIVGVAIAFQFTPAQASVESKVAQLESRILQLQYQVRRLQSQIRDLRNDNLDRANPPRRANPPSESTPSRPITSDDPMFDRLATLVIEHKDRMDRLETRIEALEEAIAD
jgi:uncharacterized coiled-coil protein SlyX